MNILTGSTFEIAQDGEPVFLLEERFSGECLTDGEWKSIRRWKSRLESLLTAHCACLPGLGLLRRPRCAGCDQCVKTFWKGRSSHEKATYARTDSTLQVRRFKLKGTFVVVTHQCKYCTSCKISCRRTGTDQRVFPDRIIFTSMFVQRHHRPRK